MTETARPRRTRIHPYVEAALAKRLSEYSSAIGATESAVVQAAVREYLDQTSDAALVLRRLDSLGRAVAHIQRDLELLSGAFGFWLKLWFARNPSAPEGAMASAESRYRQFVDYLGKQFSGGHRFIDDLPREVTGDEVELANIAAQAGSVAEPTTSAPSGEQGLGGR